MADELGNGQIRSYVDILQEYITGPISEIITEEEVEPETIVDHTSIILEDLTNLSARLRTLMETTGGDYALGFEMGMQRAAEMIENLVRRHSEETNSGS